MTTLAKPLSVNLAVCDRALLRSSQEALSSFLPSLVTTQDILAMGEHLIVASPSEQPGVLVTDLQALGENFGDTIRQLRSHATPPAIIVLHDAPDGGAILKVMRAGAQEFFFEDIAASLRNTIARIVAENRHRKTNGKLVAFMAAKGGCGVTTLASHAAADLARDPNTPVLLADLHWACPSAAFFLRVSTPFTLQAAAAGVDRMDPALWDAMISTTRYGFALAPSPAGDGSETAVEAKNLAALLQFCKSQYGTVIADCGHGVNQLTPTILEAADEVVLITSTDLTALHHTKRLLALLKAMPGGDRVRLVLNRVQKRPEMSQGELEKMLGHPVFASVLNDYRSLIQACEDGTLLPFDHAFSQSVSALSARLTGAAPARKKKRFGLFGS